MIDRYAEVGDIRLHYVEEGEGPLVVMLHGFPEFWFSWRKQIPAIAKAGYRVIAPDLRGYGQSSRPDDVDAYRMTCIVQDIAGLIVQNGGKCTLVGHDWGGIASWLLTMLHPSLIERLVILNAPHFVPMRREIDRSLEQKLRLTYQLFFNLPVLPELFLKLFGKPLMRRIGSFTPEEVQTYVDAWRKPGATTAMLNYYRAIRKHRAELRGLIRKIEMPVMLIWGERDPVFGVAMTENFSEWVPDLRVERIPEAGHFVQTDAAEKVNALLLAFLAR
ncbi:MAG TPA: alpha/beta hydrolase [Thermoanaerobaculia bacterium]|nr:alpha/beta hydrolase [Thermoanaerobaculia bacterium]